jgi:chemotaxis protein MotC
MTGRGLRRGFAGLAVLAAALPSGLGAEEAEGLEPFQMVRSLELVQDRIAGGDHAALPMQRKLLELIDARFGAERGGKFENELNRRALLVYAMSGGNPATVEAALSQLGADDPNRKLGNGILLYIKGDPKAAQDALTDVDPMAYTPDLAVYLALVKGSVLSAEKPKIAVAMLDLARLLGPGTLVEEAALRRSVAIAGLLGDPKRFMRASEQYVRYYRRSPYASQFADAFVDGVATLHAELDLKAVGDIAALMEPEQEKVIFLRIARRAAIDGLTELSAFASLRAEGMASDPRAELYSSLSSVTSETVREVAGKLARIDRGRLSENDRQLLDAASAIAAEMTAAPAAIADDAAEPEAVPVRTVGPEPVVTAPPQEALPAVEPAAKPAEPAPAAVPSTGADVTADQADAKMAEARAKLADIDKLLGDMPE